MTWSSFQTITLPTDVLTFSFDYAWSIVNNPSSTDPTGDFVRAEVVTGAAQHGGPNISGPGLDLFAGLDVFATEAAGSVEVDITAFAGLSVDFQFSVFGDAGLDQNSSDYRDTLTIANVRYATLGGPVTASVPEPSIIALFAAGLFGLGFARRRKLHQS